MSIFPNVFSDPKLRERQNQLDGQWNSLWSLYGQCNGTPTGTFAQFATDRKNWKAFYESETDWSANAKTATDGWQEVLRDWTERLRGWDCYGTPSIGVDDGAIPTVKDIPPDDPSFIDTAVETFKKAEDAVLSPFATLGWVAVGLVVVVILAIVWIATKGRVSGYGISAGAK